MQIKTNIIRNGGSLYLLIPPALVAYMQLEDGKENIIIEDNEKSKGKFAAFWRIEDDKKIKDAKDML